MSDDTTAITTDAADTDTPVALPIPVSTPAPTLDELRTSLFNGVKPDSRIITFFGQQIELRQPTVGEVEDQNRDTTNQRGAADMLVRYAYMPGTNTKIFSIHDVDSLRQLPWGPDFTALTRAIADLSGIQIEEATKN
jgi:hypothetical protein